MYKVHAFLYVDNSSLKSRQLPLAQTLNINPFFSLQIGSKLILRKAYDMITLQCLPI